MKENIDKLDIKIKLLFCKIPCEEDEKKKKTSNKLGNTFANI